MQNVHKIKLAKEVRSRKTRTVDRERISGRKDDWMWAEEGPVPLHVNKVPG
jgi:hypothetical protein